MCFAVNFGLGFWFGWEGGGWVSFFLGSMGWHTSYFWGRLTLEEVARFLVFVLFFFFKLCNNLSFLFLFLFSFFLFHFSVSFSFSFRFISSPFYPL